MAGDCAGLCPNENLGRTLSFAPFLPQAWTAYAFHINYRGRLLKVSVNKQVEIALLKGSPIALEVYGEPVQLESVYTTALKKQGA